MNVYDFDQTIYRHDSTADFYFFCLKKQPSLLRYLPFQAFSYLRYLTGNLSKTQFKERFYRFFCGIPDMQARLNAFWATHAHKICDWYMLKHRPDDVVISASPEFLLRPICEKLEIHTLIASRVDPKSGHYTGENCHGRQKVLRYREVFSHSPICEFYSDSLSDTPLAELAEESFIVKKGRIYDWKTYAYTDPRRLRKLRAYADTSRFL